MSSKPSIVFCHGIWADGSCFSKLIPPLQAEGYEVISAQYNLDSAQSDIDSVIRTLVTGLEPVHPRRPLLRRRRYHRRGNRRPRRRTRLHRRSRAR